MNENLRRMKEEYETMNASKELHDKIADAMKENKEERKGHFWRRGGIAAACLIGVFALSLNASPAFAASVSDLPGMQGIVKVLTLGRYVVEEEGFQADIVTPKIEGLLDKALEEKLNRDFKENADAVIAAFEGDMKTLQEEFPGEEVHMGVDSGYTVRTDTEEYLAIDVYILNTVGSSSTTHKFYTINKKTNDLLTLSGLFQKNADYVGVLSEYLKGEMLRVNETGEKVFWVNDDMGKNFEQIKKDQNFYIDSQGDLVICFDKYEVAPGCEGCPEFVIPRDVVADILL